MVRPSLPSWVGHTQVTNVMKSKANPHLVERFRVLSTCVLVLVGLVGM